MRNSAPHERPSQGRVKKKKNFPCENRELAQLQSRSRMNIMTVIAWVFEKKKKKKIIQLRRHI